jgi:hypothetical protein
MIYIGKVKPMQKAFDPNDTSVPNYQQLLREHYKAIRTKLGVPDVPLKGTQRLEMDVSDCPRPPRVTAVPTTPVIPIKEIPKPDPTPPMDQEEKERIQQGHYPLINEQNMPVSPKAVLPIVCKAHDLDFELALSANKTQPVILKRARVLQTLFVMYGKKLTMSEVGRIFNKDRTTFIHLIKLYGIDKSATVYKHPVKQKTRKVRHGFL